MCNSHRRKYLKHGTVEGAGRAGRGEPWRWLVQSVRSRRRDVGCWVDRPWKSQSNGYPTATPPGRTQRRAGHLVLELDGRPRPKGAVMMHLCDVTECLNPDHLKWGTQQENIEDMRRKGRARNNPKRGEKSPNAKLTEEVVREIRRRVEQGEYRKTIANELGLSEGHVGRIVDRKAWAHVK